MIQKFPMPMVCILGIAFITAMFFGYYNGAFSLRTLADYKNDPSIYNDMALTMLHTRSLVDEDFSFAEPYRKSPGYPLMLAVAYGVLGERPLSAYMFGMFFWLGSILLLWKISGRFLPDPVAYIPPFLLSLYWGVATFVIGIASDIFGMFLVLLFVYSLFIFSDKGTMRHLFSAAFSVGFLLITKPIMLYGAPLLCASFIMSLNAASKRNFALRLTAFMCAILFLGAWMVYNHALVGTYQLASGAATLSKRADDIYLTGRRAALFFLASGFGNYIADRISPGYADDPEPHTIESLRRQKAYARSFTRSDLQRDRDIQQAFYDQLFEMIKERPIKFIVLGIPYMLRMNAPTNLEGVEIISLFSGTYNNIPPPMKIGILILLRSIWFVFLATVVVGIVYALKTWRQWFTIVWLLVFMNSVYALVSHGEARFLIPVMPFYFLFAVYAYYSFRRGHITRAT